MKRWITAGAAVIALLVPSSASAHQRVAKTKLAFDVFGLVYHDGSYDYDYIAVVGPLTLPLPCANHRTVRVFRDEPHGADTLIGSHRSDLFGTAIVTRHEPALDTVTGDYYATVDPVRKRKRGHHRLKCTGARSRTVTVTEPVFHAVNRPLGADRVGQLASPG